jgi:hypothetical protein
MGKRRRERRQVGDRKANASEPLMKCRYLVKWHQNRGDQCDPGISLAGVPFYWPGGVRHRGGASLFCGFCMERRKAGSDNGACWLSLTAIGGGRREGECLVTEIAGHGVPMRDSLADRLVVAVMLL